MESVTLYHGDNGVQEFWESDDHAVLILRVHQEDAWTGWLDQGNGLHVLTDIDRQERAKKGVHCILSGKTPNNVAKLLKKQYKVAVAFDTQHKWTKNGRIIKR